MKIIGTWRKRPMLVGMALTWKTIATRSKKLDAVSLHASFFVSPEQLRSVRRCTLCLIIQTPHSIIPNIPSILHSFTHSTHSPIHVYSVPTYIVHVQCILCVHTRRCSFFSCLRYSVIFSAHSSIRFYFDEISCTVNICFDFFYSFSFR